jgi:two-component system phosphate regulon sensor histidine kinase PhoR
MINRWLTFAAFLLLGSGFGWVLAGKDGIEPGLLVAGFAWLLLDSLHISRLLRWLRTEQNVEEPGVLSSMAPGIGGVWGDLADRTRRLLKSRDRRYLESQARLNEFLSAMQASPNGVVLLDADGRIEWCNQTAAQHFGFDAQRDVMQHIANLVRDPVFTAYLASGNFRGM